MLGVGNGYWLGGDFSYRYSAWMVLTQPMLQVPQDQNEHVAKYCMTDNTHSILCLTDFKLKFHLEVVFQITGNILKTFMRQLYATVIKDTFSGTSFTALLLQAKYNGYLNPKL